jgi:hypothetical protein
MGRALFARDIAMIPGFEKLFWRILGQPVPHHQARKRSGSRSIAEKIRQN